MHELSVSRSLVAEVSRIAARNAGCRVTRITVRIGPLSGIEIPLLERAYLATRKGTVAQDATLEIETAAVRVWCKACRCGSEATINQLLCRACGSWQVDLRSGDELLLKSLEMETQSPEAAGHAEAPAPGAMET